MTERIKSIQIGGRRPIGGLTLITIVLIFLRAFDVIQCSWIWVFAPMWGPVAIVLAVLTGIFIFGLCAAIKEDWDDKARARKLRRRSSRR